jgi:hypothetical protein
MGTESRRAAQTSRKFLVRYNKELAGDIKELEVYGGKK